MRKMLLLLLAVVCPAMLLLGQTKTIRGKVTDATGSPIPNASIIIKGTNTGTTSNSDGIFSLTVSESSRALVISAVGMEPHEVSLANKTFIEVSLKPEDKSLQEVVVTSFGITRDKKLLGYSAPVVKADELTAVKNTNLTNAIAGKVAGVRVQGSGGSFTGGNVLIRGNTSVTGLSAPLYVVDGVPIDNSGGGTALQTGPSTTNRAVDLNPEDIESMTVLKGAAATSSYGSRGAAGVILITTKKGRRRAKNSVEINSSYNMVQVNRLPEYQNQYAQGVGGNFNPTAANSWGPEIKGQEVTNYLGQKEKLQAYPDNVKDIFENGFNLQNNISFSGGSDRTSYRVSYGNTQETFVIRNNRFRRNNLTVNLNSELTSKLTVSAFVNYNNTGSKRTTQGNQLANPLFRAWFTPRSYNLTGMPVYDAAGNQSHFGGEDNPYWAIDNVKYRDDVNRIFGNAGLKYKFTDWLSADLKVGADIFSFRSTGFDEIGGRGGGNVNNPPGGGIQEVRNTTRNYNSYFTIAANKTFGNFGTSLVIGNEILDNRLASATITGRDLVVKGFEHMSNAKTIAGTTNDSRTRLIGFFADAVVEYNNWASLNLKVRMDKTSTLPKENNTFYYPAAAVSANITEALPSLKSKWLNAFKLRANIGLVGRGPGAYNTDTYFNLAAPGDGFGPTINVPYDGLVAYSLSNGAGNPNLKPEFTREWEIGTDITLLDNRVNIEFNYYQRKLTEGLFPVPYSAASGVTSVFSNAGELETKGVEVSLGVTPIRSENFTWNINANFTKFKVTVTKLAPGVPLIFLAGFTTPNIRLVQGEEYNSIYGNMYQRDKQGRLILNATTGLPLPTTDVFKIGNPNPKWTMGLNNSFKAYGFTLDVLLDIREGGDMYSRNVADMRRNGVVKETAEFARFDKDGNPNKPYKFDGVDVNGNPVNVPLTAEQYWGNTGKYVAAEGYIVSTSWIRVREATISYSLPKKLLDKTPFGNVDFGLFGRNLFLKTDFPHLDPEQNVLGISTAQGLEFNAQPSTRTIGFNVRLTF
jgi:TonB-linked SusC/RagA family outer membrane protein